MCIAASACSDEAPNLTRETDRVAPPVNAQQTLTAERIARAIAEALSDPKLRDKLDAEMENSPVVEQKLHLRPYLRGAGGQLASAMARAGETGRDGIAQLMQTLGSPKFICRFLNTGTHGMVAKISLWPLA